MPREPKERNILLSKFYNNSQKRPKYAEGRIKNWSTIW